MIFTYLSKRSVKESLKIANELNSAVTDPSNSLKMTDRLNEKSKL